MIVIIQNIYNILLSFVESRWRARTLSMFCICVKNNRRTINAAAARSPTATVGHVTQSHGHSPQNPQLWDHRARARLHVLGTHNHKTREHTAAAAAAATAHRLFKCLAIALVK